MNRKNKKKEKKLIHTQMNFDEKRTELSEIVGPDEDRFRFAPLFYPQGEGFFHRVCFFGNFGKRNVKILKFL